MKKIILSLLLLVAGIGMASAQYDYSSASRLDSIENALASANSRLAQLRADSVHQAVWRTGRYFNVGYAIASTSTDFYKAEKGKFGFFINKGTSYLWPRKSPIGGMLKLGLDVRWIDMQFTMYDKFTRTVESRDYGYNNNYYGWISDMNPSVNENDRQPNYAKFSHMSALVGALGVGPTLTLAPLTFMDNAASSLRLNVYFHYQPTFGLNFYQGQPVYAAPGTAPVDGVDCGDSELAAEYGYVNMFDWGFKLQWSNFGLGMECRWGSGKFTNSSFYPNNYSYTTFNGRPINMNGAPDGEDGSYTRKFAETRIYLDFVF